MKNVEVEDLRLLSLREKLSRIQFEFKASKSKFNSFGKYNFRSAEDILEGLKPFNEKYGVYFTIEEHLISSTTIPIICSTATVFDTKENECLPIKAMALVGVDLAQKGMQTPQAFGSASSYGKKYAFGNLLLIDDTADADATNSHGNSKLTEKSYAKPRIDVNTESYDKAADFVKKGGDMEIILSKYNVSPEAVKLLNSIK